MNNALYIISFLLFVAWLIGFFGYHANSLVHALLIMSAGALVLKGIISVDDDLPKHHTKEV